MGLKDTANFAVIPSAYKSGVVYSILPTNGDMDLSYSMSSTQSKYDSIGSLKTCGVNLAPLNYFISDGELTGFPELQLPKSRTNILKHTTTFSSDWTAFNGTISSGSTSSINVTGSFGVTRFTETTANSTHYIAQTLSGMSINRYYVFSMYVRPYGRELMRIQMSNSTDDTCLFEFDLLNVNKIDAGQPTNNGLIQKLPNGWYRISCIFRANASTGTLRIANYTRVSGTPTGSYAGTAGLGFEIYGAQLEGNPTAQVDAYEPSPYILTTTAAVTRTSPTLASFNNTPSKAVINKGYPVTIYWEGKIDRFNSASSAFSIFDYTDNQKYIALNFQNSFTLMIRRRNGGSEFVGTAGFRMKKEDYLKIVLVLNDSTNYELYVNGFLIEGFSGSEVTWAFDGVRIGCGLAPSNDTGQRQSFNQFFYWNKAFTADEAKEVTSYLSYEQMASASNFKLV